MLVLGVLEDRLAGVVRKVRRPFTEGSVADGHSLERNSVNGRQNLAKKKEAKDPGISGLGEVSGRETGRQYLR